MLRVELELNSYYRKCNGNLVYILYCLTTGGGGGGEGGREGGMGAVTEESQL